MKLSTLFAAMTLVAGAGVANAGEPIQLSATEMDNVSAGTTSYNIAFKQYKNLSANIKENSLVTSLSLIKGNTAVGTADAVAEGANTFSEASVQTYTNDYASVSSASGVSSTGW